MIPVMPIQDWCRTLSSHAPMSQPTKAETGRRTAICIIFSASTRLESALDCLGRGLGSGIGALKGINRVYTRSGARRAMRAGTYRHRNTYEWERGGPLAALICRLQSHLQNSFNSVI